MTRPRDAAMSGDRAGSPLTPDDVSAASGGMALVVVAPLPASTKAPTPSQILVFTFIANPDDERSGRPAPDRNISRPRRAARRGGCAGYIWPWPESVQSRLRVKSVQIESRFRSRYLFGRMILSEKSATFRDHAPGICLVA